MASLQSKFFRGDPKLEAASTVDSAHIKPGATGLHVNKIQAALIVLDGASISSEDMQHTVYGTSTANSVLAYKQKRDIINRSYQTKADNIVGKMTMERLDEEMLAWEAQPRDPVQIKPVSYSRVRPPRSHALVSFLLNVHAPESNIAMTQAVTSTGNPSGSSAPVARSSILPNVVLELRRNSIGTIVVVDGDPGDVVVEDPAIAKIRPDAPVPPAERALVVDSPQTFKIFSGKILGRTRIIANCFGATASIDVVVKTFFDPPVYVAGENHGHRPSGRYAEVRANPNNAPGLYGKILDGVCPYMSAEGLIDLARRVMFADKPIALKHLDWYLSQGHGAVFNEDDNITDWLTRDAGIKARLKHEIFSGRGRPKGEGHFEFNQEKYEVDDFQFAFGSIDRVDFQVDFSQDTVRVWFLDRYEWHPVYPFYDFQNGDGIRETNCLHAALVEQKPSGAADFWMQGQAEVSLSSLLGRH